jgi:hypothetical protein
VIWASYVIIFSGIFVFLAFLIVTFVLRKNELKYGPWLFFSFAGILTAIAELFRIAGAETIYQILLASSMILMLLIALIKYWYIMELTQ